VPAAVLAHQHYTSRLFESDLIAGVTVGLVALPRAMAFAISSAMTPQAGIAMLGASESLLSAVVVDRMIWRERPRPSQPPAA
jgi:SulP family sulfate permease